MSLRDDIDREFPFQIALSLDDGLKGVLDWLDERIGRWDMYVDLEGHTIHYCFRDARTRSRSSGALCCGRRDNSSFLPP